MKLGRRPIGLAICVLFAAAAPTQQPNVTNAQLATRSAGAELEREFRALVAVQASPAWIRYAVPIVEGNHWMCCGSWSSGRDAQWGHGCCRLEAKSETYVRNTNEARSVRLEVSHLFVLFRVEHRQVGKIRSFSEECELDAGGLPFFWLTEVRSGESLALLSSFVRGDAAESGRESSDEDKASRKLSRAAVAATAMHRDLLADAALERLVATGQPEWLRKDVTFWLGSARGQRGYEVLRRMLREDPSDPVREQAVFGLHVSKVPGAVEAIIQTAKQDRSSRVRGQALFWLAQRAGQKASEAITDAIENDPETDVKKKAVFALSQLPKDEGVPLLIQVARTNRNPAVRKQAIFWLGQSNDPRALAFFEEVLR